MQKKKFVNSRFILPIKVGLRLAGILGIYSVIFYWQKSALAQIIPDASLGVTEQSEVRRDVDVRGSLSDLIEGGAVRGNNLFHSFSEFNVNDGQRVYFANPAAIENIISRVTGNNPSNILGTLGIDGKASLFFINPNGIIFGENAKLDIAGSFLASTAKSLVFENGFEFSTENPEQPPLLTINVPRGLQLGVNSGEILLKKSGSVGTGLQIQSQQTIGLIANGVISQGGVISAGQIEIGSVGDESIIGIIPQDSGFKFQYDEVNNFADIRVEDRSDFQIFFGGDLTINGREIILKESYITLEFSGDLTINGRDITVSSVDINSLDSGDLTISGRDIILKESSILLGTILLGNSGDLTINGRNINVSRGLITSAFSGNLAINAGQISLNQSPIVSLSSKDTTINSEGVTLSEDSAIALLQKSGNLTINSLNLTVSGQSFILSEGSKDLTLSSNNISLNGSAIAQINGNGSLKIEAYDSLQIGGQPYLVMPPSIISHKVSDNSASGGENLTINTRNLIIHDGGQILSLTQSSSLGSSILINATNSIEVAGQTQLNNQSFSPSQIIAASGSITSQNPFEALSGGKGLEIDITGPGGNLSINTGKLTVSDEGLVTVRSTALGDAGTLTIAADSILLDNKGKITATSDNAQGGNINLTASDLLLMRRNSLISAQSFGTDSQDGNIKINTDFVIALPSEDSDIIARSTNRGDIDITADSVIGYQYGELTPLSDITASGTLTLNLPNVDPTQGLTELPTDLVDPTQQIDESCAARAREEDESKFTVTGRGGLPQSPNEVLTPDTVLDDFGTLATREGDVGMRVDEDAKNSPTTPSTSNSHSPIPKRPNQIVEAQGWVVDAQGVVTLVAQAPTVTPHTVAMTSASCGTRQ